VIGQADFTHSVTVFIVREVECGPQGVWIQNGKLFVSDTQDNRVLILQPDSHREWRSADIVLGPLISPLRGGDYQN